MPQDWDNVSVLERNRELCRSPLGAFSDFDSALIGDRTKSSNQLDMNGSWRFHLAESPSQVPSEFQASNYDDSGWDEIPVPSNWQLLGDQSRPVARKNFFESMIYLVGLFIAVLVDVNV